MSIYALTFIVSFFYVGVKSLQQLNVTHKLYALIVPFSVIMAALEIFVVSTVAKNGAEQLVELALALGLGGGFGSVCATFMHHRFMEKK